MSSAGRAGRYKRLLEDYHAAIGRPDWPAAVEPLVREMDRLWGRVSPAERKACLEHAEALYEARLGDGPRPVLPPCQERAGAGE